MNWLSLSENLIIPGWTEPVIYVSNFVTYRLVYVKFRIMIISTFLFLSTEKGLLMYSRLIMGTECM